MTDSSFLDQIGKLVIEKYGDSLHNTVIILPNNRAKVFLVNALRKQISTAVFSPRIISIEQLIQEISKLRLVDPIELLFEFYEVYLTVTEKSEQEPFEQFANWGKTVLQDFNEIDRYHIEPSKILGYLDDIKVLEHWSLDSSPKTELITKHLKFWKLLPLYYSSLYDYLLKNGKGYQGMIYREAIKNIEEFQAQMVNSNMLFVGFNALNAAEEILIQYLQTSIGAKVYWDIDEVLLNDLEHDAGLFLRNYRSSWKYYKSNPFEWSNSEFTKPKNIQIIGTPKSIGQAKIVGQIVEQLQLDNPNESLSNTAIILGEENLLVPLLYNLPESVGNLNITMGYSSKNNPAQILIGKMLKMHSNAIARKDGNYVFYYKDVLDILTHPLVEPYIAARELVNVIKKYNYSFISQNKLFELKQNPNQMFHLLFDRCDTNMTAVLENIAKLLNYIKDRFDKEIEEEKMAKTFLYSVFKVINKLITYTSKYQQIESIATLQTVYKQIIDMAEVSFEGEPLSGLQIMGVLESRVLDFETVIITSMNEGKFPAGKSSNSFIPYDVKREYGLPTFKEKDAIYTYHFYHLLQRAKKVYLIYNTESEGFDAGEKSRFITQLEIEKRENHQVTHDIYDAVLPKIAKKSSIIPKSESVLVRLREMATNGFSPSSLTSYIRNPLDFYFQKILKIREMEEVEETIAVNTLGTIIHETLKVFYKPLEGKFLSTAVLEGFLKEIDQEVLRQFKLFYKEGEIKKGKNLLAFEVAKRHIYNFIHRELESINSGEDIKIIAIEKTYERVLEHPNMPYPILIRGNVDRIDETKGKIRIIDYKTGKVEQRNVSLRTWDGLTEDISNDKIIQVLLYAFMFFEEAEGKEIEAGIISFKNLKSGFLPFTYKGDGQAGSTITAAVLESFIEQVSFLVGEIFNVDLPFEEKVQ